jgi:hypothetical protein
MCPVIASIFSGVIVFSEQAIASDYPSKIALSVLFGFGRGSICTSHSSDEVINR